MWKYLSRHRKRRKHRLGRPDQRGRIEGRKFIEERPDSVHNRNRYGHREGDTVIGSHHKGVVFTTIERKSRYMMAWNTGTKCAKKMSQTVNNIFKNIPAKLKKTLTLDNGLEFSGHSTISKQTGLDVYFSHPGCPYEKGAIENGRGQCKC